MPTWSSPKIFATLLLSLGFLSLAQPAHAGFEWVAPAEPAAPAPSSAPAVQDQPLTAYAPAPQVQSPELISPVVIDGHAGMPSAMPSPAPETASAPGIASAPVAPSAATTISTSHAMPGSLPDNAPGDIVHGFANNVPLSVALREILPPGYGFSIDPDVDMGTLVSFRGGKPWRETLKDTLDLAGLGMHERGQTVVIGRGGAMDGGMPPSASSGPVVNHGPAMVMGSPPHDLNAPMDVALLAASVTPVVTPTNVPPPSDAGAALQTWNAQRGDSLHKIMEQWCARANVEFNWLAEYDYPLQASVAFTGTFEEAVRNILAGFETAHPQPIAELHANPNANQMVLVVTTRGNNYSD